MITLVPCQRRPSSEGFLAIGIRTFVWAFARMYATMSSKGAGIAERLRSKSAREQTASNADLL